MPARPVKRCDGAVDAAPILHELGVCIPWWPRRQVMFESVDPNLQLSRAPSAPILGIVVCTIIENNTTLFQKYTCTTRSEKACHIHTHNPLGERKKTRKPLQTCLWLTVVLTVVMTCERKRVQRVYLYDSLCLCAWKWFGTASFSIGRHSLWTYWILVCIVRLSNLLKKYEQYQYHLWLGTAEGVAGLLALVHGGTCLRSIYSACSMYEYLIHTQYIQYVYTIYYIM